MTHKPLAGVRVLEFGGYISGPYATSILCSLGADVVKVERPGVGEDFRRGANIDSLYFRQYNTGKRSLAVNLKDPEGVALVKALLPRFDVVLENLRPGKMDALGLGRGDLTALRSDLIYTSVTGFGNGGPMVDRPAYDMIGQAFGGLVSTLSNEGHAQLAGTCLADLITGLSTATGILAALVGRGAGGGSTHVETSLTEAISTLTIDAVTQLFETGRAPSRQSRHPQAQNFCLATASGEFIVLHLSSSQRFWECLVAAMDRPELLADARFTTYADRMVHYHDLAKILEGEFLVRPAAEWEKLLIDHDVPFAPVLDVKTYREHPQVEWLDIFERETDGLALTRVPWRFDGERPRRPGTAPLVGEHSLEIAGEVYGEDELRSLVASGTLFPAPASSSASK
ncbi:CoA transferase [Aeromicrobium senzhongii]|uniref:CoA transferase n=1 Tax=Aeromicrobium senzhongii TaxID=2663859 RepID=A0ABX6SQW5_9ACTN|nr:CoA transferase [Aeromicrobium senzhongii]MTB88950.1 CoA transferase [Aeromicrobium senzhongii]QNL93768.1 CoA transferase [Aeromicrobium senzhongii]